MKKLIEFESNNAEDIEHTSKTTVYSFSDWEEQLEFEDKDYKEQIDFLFDYGHYTTSGHFVEAGGRTVGLSFVQDKHLLFVTQKYGYNI